MNLSKLGSPDHADADSFQDFTRWYISDNGKMFGHNSKEYSEHCVRTLSADPQSCDDTEKMVSRIVEEKPHSCMHRFARHLDIQLSSIGALKWRGSVPQCQCLSKTSWIHFIEQDCGVRSWSTGSEPANEYAETVHATLGTPTDRKKAIVDSFLCAQDRGSVYAGGWIGEQSEKRGRNARLLFGINES